MCDSVSTVPPDFEDTTNSVLSRSTASSSALTASGSVESSTCSSSPPSRLPKLRRITSGPRLEPPMPSSAACVKPSALTSSTKAPRSSTCSSIVSEMVSQPRRSPISGPGPPHSVSSLRQMRRATFSSTAVLTRSASGPSSSSGIDESTLGGRPMIAASLLDSTPAINWSKGSTNFAMPSSSSFLVTSPMSIPASARALSALDGSWSAAEKAEIKGATADQDPSKALKALAEAGIDMGDVTKKLLEDGIAKFVEPFDQLIAGVESSKEAAIMGRPPRVDSSIPDELEGPLAERVKTAVEENVARRIWRKDETLWGGPGPEIGDRLGWLTISETMLEHVDDLGAFVDEVKLSLIH